LVALAPDDRRLEVIDAIYAAYFEFGRDIGDLDVLLDIAAECGLDAAKLRPLLEGDAARSEVEDDVERARQAGISGVPFFIINDRYAFSGAHPPETILRVMRQVLAEGEPAS
jgi:predicted DsbA family dithiol-disulfide isomerase